MAVPHWLLLLWISLVLDITVKKSTGSGVQNVCDGQSFQATCGPGEVVVMENAEYGRMEKDICGVTDVLGHVGCRNDFLGFLDQKCSGRQECSVIVGGNDFHEANIQCVRELRAYLRVSYTCVQVVYKDKSHCLIPKSLPLIGQEGFLASQVTDETGCGTSRTPWTIDVMAGQTINLTIFDFGALSPDRSSHYVRCQDTYGFILERSLSVNQSICGSSQRQRLLYSSATNKAEVQLIQQSRRRDNNLFVIKYKVVGCSDLTPPPHSYYKRDGNEAVIGCDGTETVWKLVCKGNTWDGMVGNCTAKIAALASETESVPMKPMLIVAAIIGATIVTAVLIVVSGVVYIKRYRHAEEVKTSTMQWTLHYKPKADVTAQGPPRGGTYRPMTCAHSRSEPAPTSTSRAPTLAKPRRPPPSTGTGKPLQHIWEMPLPDPHANSKKDAPPSEGIYQNPTEICTCNSMPLTPNGQAIPLTPITVQPSANGQPSPHVNTNSGIMSAPILPSHDGTNNTNTLINDGDDISCFYAPNTGHKYYVLERQDPGLQNLPPPPDDL